MRIITNNPVEIYSNGEGDAGKAAAVTAGIGALGALAAAKLGQQPSELKQACGRKPLFKKKRGEYNACVKNFYDSKNVQSQPQLQGGVIADKTEQGLSKNWKIGLAVGGGVVLVAVIVYLIKRSQNKGK